MTGEILTGEILTGEVKWYSEVKRFGFIIRTLEDGSKDTSAEEVFLHSSAVETAKGFSEEERANGVTLNPGDKVTFALSEGKRDGTGRKRPCAIHLTVFKDDSVNKPSGAVTGG